MKKSISSGIGLCVAFLVFQTTSLAAIQADLTTTFSGKTATSITATATPSSPSLAITATPFTASDLVKLDYSGSEIQPDVTPGATIGFQTGGTVGTVATNFTPNTNVESAAGWQFLLHYNLQSDATLNGVTLKAIIFTGGGATQNYAHQVQFRVEVLDEEGGLLNTGDNSWVSCEIGTSTSGTDFAFNFQAPVSLQSGKTFTIRIGCRRDEAKAGCFIGLRSIFMPFDILGITECTRTQGGAWSDPLWTVGGVENQSWVPNANATITLADGDVLTLTEPASATAVTISGAATLTSVDAASTLTVIDSLTIASAIGEIFTVAASLAALEGREFRLNANGDGFATGGGTGGYTIFTPIALDATALRIGAGTVRASTFNPQGVPFIFDGGGMVDNLYTETLDFTREIQIGTHDAPYRLWSDITARITGPIKNETGVTAPGAFTHTDAGTLFIDGDIAGYTGTLANKAGTLILTNTTTTASGNTIALNGGTVIYDIPAGEAVTYPGAFTGSSASFTKRGAGALTLSGSSTSRVSLQIAAGTLTITSTGIFGGSDDQSASERLRVTNGATLVLQKDWNYGSTYAFGPLGHNAIMRVAGGTIRFETNSEKTQNNSNTSRGCTIGTGGATIEIAPGFTYTKLKSAGYSGDCFRFENAGTTLTLAGTGTGVVHDDIPFYKTGAIQGLDSGAVNITGSNWTLNGAYTYTGGTTVAPGGTLKGTGTFGNSPLAINGTIETGATVQDLVFNTGATITVAPGKTIAVTGSLTTAPGITVELAAEPAKDEKIYFMTLPQGAAITRSDFTVTGFEHADRYRVLQTGQDVYIQYTQGILISIY